MTNITKCVALPVPEQIRSHLTGGESDRWLMVCLSRASGSKPTVTETAHRVEEEYAGEETPLATYAALLATFTAAGGSVLAGAARRGKMPDRFGVYDLVLTSVATQHLARLITKDRVTSPLRAPFTRYQKRGRPSELEEEPRRSGPGLAVGQLLVCPFCIGQWIALGFVSGLLFAPRTTRTVASVLAIGGVADALQEAYARAVPES